MPETREQVAKRTRTGPTEDGLRWRVPCGAEFSDEVIAGYHYIGCDACDRAHRARNFKPLY